MSLPVTNLDDRSFQQLVDEAKRKIPELCPEWTNHNLSDPGVALIELFAWMTETTLFRLNQVPDVFYTRMLNLLGFDQFPAAAAQAELMFWLTGGQQSVTIPAGVQVSTSGSVGEPQVFTTLETTTITQPTMKAALTSEDARYTDVWEDLSHGLADVKCFPRQPLNPGDCFYLGFENSLAGMALRLTVEASVEGIGVVPENPPLEWEVWQGKAWIPARVPALLEPDEIADTTGGLNRNGTILLIIPGEHEPLTLGATRAHWLRAKLLPSGPDRPSYRASPQLRRISASALGGAVPAEHSEPVGAEMLGTSSGKPDQAFRCARKPVLPRTPDGETLEVEDETGLTSWEEVDDFVDSHQGSRHFTWDSFTGEVRFGPLIRYSDGTMRQHGAVPHEGARIRLTGYRTGGGAAGNVGAGSLVSLRSSIPFVRGVQNLESATGGVDAESVENAKLRGPQSMRSGGRAVTVSDFERLAKEADSRIARVRCLPPVTPGDPVRLLIVPAIEQPTHELSLDDFALPDDMIDRIDDYLDDRRILGSTIEVSTPFYQGVTIAARLDARPGAPASLVRDRAMQALYDFVNPLSGGQDGGGWAFNTDLNSALVYQLLDAVEGVDTVDEVLFFEYDLRNHVRKGFGKELVKLAPKSLFLSMNHQVVVRARRQQGVAR